KITITITGMILFAGASISALSGLSVAPLGTRLSLWGLGWFFGLIGATTSVTDCSHPQERNKVQAANDFLLLGRVALSSFSSGRLLALHGWDGINIWSLPVIAVTILLLLILGLYERNNQNHIIAAEGS